MGREGLQANKAFREQYKLTIPSGFAGQPVYNVLGETEPIIVMNFVETWVAL